MSTDKRIEGALTERSASEELPSGEVARVAVRIGNYNIEADALQRWYDTARFDEHFPGALMAAIEEMLEPGFVPLTESNPDYHPLTTLDDLPTDELEALYELTGVQRADQTSPELHRARKWLSDAVYERHHGPIKIVGPPIDGETHVFVATEPRGRLRSFYGRRFIVPRADFKAGIYDATHGAFDGSEIDRRAAFECKGCGYPNLYSFGRKLGLLIRWWRA